MAGLAPELPLRRDDLDGYALIKRHAVLAQQNLKMLILTNPGERMMSPLFGVGIKKFLFEPNHESTYVRIEMEIKSQVKRFLPYLDIIDTKFRRSTGPDTAYSDNLLNIEIKYYIKPLRKVQSYLLLYNYELEKLT